MPSTSSTSVGRGLLFGTMAGLFAGGLAVLWMGARALYIGPDCAPLTPEECALERQIALVMGRQQVMFGAALALLGVALYLFIRSKGARRDRARLPEHP